MCAYQHASHRSQTPTSLNASPSLYCSGSAAQPLRASSKWHGCGIVRSLAT